MLKFLGTVTNDFAIELTGARTSRSASMRPIGAVFFFFFPSCIKKFQRGSQSALPC